ncbi:MAG TPA: hypothetical protein VNO30_24680 [Kofleriaceae bacterium]|nr:hypothetical protein [Kofleriaceae bacterium]
MQKSVLFALFAAAAVGCGGGNQMDGGGDDSPPPTDASVTPDSPPPPPGFTRLVGRTWTVPSGQQDVYRCVRVTIPQDTYITNILAQAPLGTHHTVLSIASGSAAGADGEQDCNAGTLGTVMLYASGVGTSPLDFPADVGIKVAAGTQVHLNLHLYNASDQTLSGDSAILVKAQSTPPPMLAEMVFAGTGNFQIPSGSQPYTKTTSCNVSSPYRLFAVWPHMHKLATHQKVELIRGGTPTVLHDLAYNFTEQKYYLKAPEVQVMQGDQIRVSCTWVNTTGSSVGFGESSDKEMCFSGLYRYPAANAGLFSCIGL